MNLYTIRERLKSLLKQQHLFCYYGLRGQNDSFEGKIIQIYPRIFLIETNNHVIKSFSYSDFATKLLRILR
ncbi:MAG: hypothetical protein IKF71_00195 [Bacilli bacterium]|nr:hypothetical protein [Bacilli bacterium]